MEAPPSVSTMARCSHQVLVVREPSPKALHPTLAWVALVVPGGLPFETSARVSRAHAHPASPKDVDGEIEVRQLFELDDFVQGPTIARFRELTSIDRIAADVELARPDLSSATAPNGTATILFTDIEGSTQLTERLGDREWMSLLREHNEIVRTQAATQSGFEVKAQGDGFMLAFASPVTPSAARSGSS